MSPQENSTDNSKEDSSEGASTQYRPVPAFAQLAENRQRAAEERERRQAMSTADMSGSQPTRGGPASWTGSGHPHSGPQFSGMPQSQPYGYFLPAGSVMSQPPPMSFSGVPVRAAPRPPHNTGPLAGDPSFQGYMEQLQAAGSALQTQMEHSNTLRATGSNDTLAGSATTSASRVEPAPAWSNSGQFTEEPSNMQLPANQVISNHPNHYAWLPELSLARYPHDLFAGQSLLTWIGNPRYNPQASDMVDRTPGSLAVISFNGELNTDGFPLYSIDLTDGFEGQWVPMSAQAPDHAEQPYP